MLTTIRLEKSLAPYLKQLEQERLSLLERLKSRSKTIVGFALGLFVTVSLFSVYQWQSGYMEPTWAAFIVGIAAFLALVMGGTIYTLTTAPINKKYNNSIKSKIYSKALQQYNSSILYYPERYIEEAIFKQAKLFGGFNYYTGDDLCEGHLESGRAFRFSELNVLYKEHSSNSNNGTNKTRTIFKGLFYVVDLPTPLGAQIKIVPDLSEKTFAAVGKFMQGILNKAFSSVSMEHPIVRFDEQYPAFERNFKVYSNDETVARQFITPALVAQIEAFQRLVGEEVYLLFDNDQCKFGVRGGEFLNVDIKRSLWSTIFIDQLEENLDRCFSLLAHVEKMGTIGMTKDASNPLEQSAFKTKLDPDIPTSFPKNKPSVSYKKSNSKDNPFLL